MKRLLLIIAVVAAAASSAAAWTLDEVASWGKFPRFCVNTYNWGREFFNGFDTTYVKGTGYPFNLKIKTESWSDTYGIDFDNGAEMRMVSRPSTTLGFHLTYLAVSAGYDMNVSKYFGGSSQMKQRFDFQFNCMLFTAGLYFISNDIGTNIYRFRSPDGVNYHPRFHFDGINTRDFGLDLCYYFTHKRYSSAAAFNFGRVQVKSGGSFYLGFNYNRQVYEFDFADLPAYMASYIPDIHYKVNSHNYLLKLGYGYNIVLGKNWVIGLSESPQIGLNRGFISDGDDERLTFAMLSKTQGSVVYNNGRWFAGAIGTIDASISRNSGRQLVSAYFTAELSAGYRFRLW